MRRKFLKFFTSSFLAYLLLPYKFAFSVTKKIINKNLTNQQKIFYLMKALKDLFQAHYYMKKEKVIITVRIVGQSYLAQRLNLIVEQDGHLLVNLYPVHSKLK